MRMLGMHGTAFANYAVDDCDFLIAVGARFDDRVAGSAGEIRAATRSALRTSTSIAPRVNKVKRVQWSHVGLLPEALRALHAHGQREQFKRDYAALARPARRAQAQATRMNYDRASELIQPYYVIEEINRLTQRRGHHHHRRRPASDVGRAVLRFSRAAALAHLGQHGHDGLRPAGGDRRADRASATGWSSTSTATRSIRMNIGELETVTTYDLPVKVVVLNNFGDGMVKQWQKLFFKGRLSASDRSLHKKDFVKAAQADGFRYAVRLDRKEDVPRVDRGVHRIRRARHSSKS